MPRPKVPYPRMHHKIISTVIDGKRIYFKVYKRRKHSGYVATPSRFPYKYVTKGKKRRE